jgi:ATP synthase protein I
MADDQSPRGSEPGSAGTGAGQGWTAIAYLIGGMAVWGVIGWLVDRWLDTGGIATAVGVVVGMAGGVYLVARRLGT